VVVFELELRHVGGRALGLRIADPALQVATRKPRGDVRECGTDRRSELADRVAAIAALDKVAFFMAPL
jgi:hypothetical protein